MSNANHDKSPSVTVSEKSISDHAGSPPPTSSAQTESTAVCSIIRLSNDDFGRNSDSDSDALVPNDSHSESDSGNKCVPVPDDRKFSSDKYERVSIHGYTIHVPSRDIAVKCVNYFHLL